MDKVKPLSVTEVAAGFRGEFAAAPVGVAYRAAMAATAAAMVLLPLVYLSLALAAAWGVWWWLGAGLAIFRHSVNILSALLYIAPAFAGGVVVVFLFKPFFAARSATLDPVTVDLDREPALREFLDQICRRMNVELPTLVQIDAAVNASASFRRGWRSLGRRDLCLTLGAPLVRGLTVRQLAGVVAHEFGHFSQRSGMLSQFLIRTINSWFMAAVFGRDQWDEWLVRNSEDTDWRIALVLWCARGGVWVSRRILHGLLYVAHALSCWLSRQMEFDADYYGAHVQGSESFADTARAISLLSVAEGRATEDVNAWWSDRRIVPDFSALVARRCELLPTEVPAALDKAQAEEKTLWHQTHPCMRDRIEQARRHAAPGTLTCDEPAARLFADFAANAREVTTALYRHAVGDQLKSAAPLTPDEIDRRIARDDHQAAALHRLTGGAVGLDRPVLLTLAEIAPGAPDPVVTADELSAWYHSHADQLPKAIAEDNQAYHRLHELAGARRLIECGVGVKPGTFRLKASTLEAVASASAEATQARLQYDGLFTETAQRVRGRLRGFARLAQKKPTRPEAAQLQARLEAFASLSPFFTPLPRLLQLQAVVQLFEANHAALAANGKFSIGYGALRDEARKALDQWLATASGVPDPFAGENQRSVADTIRSEAKESDCHTQLTTQVGAAIRLYFRLLAESAALAETLERDVTPP